MEMNKSLLFPAFCVAALLLLGCLGSSAQPTAVPSTLPTGAVTGVLDSPTPLPTDAGISAPSDIPPLPSDSPGIQPSASASSPAVQEIAVTANRFEFDPGTSTPITVKKGILVRLLITVPAYDTAHGISIPELGVSAQLPVGQTTAVEFTPSQSGTFTFMCNVFCGSGHRSMRGTLVVTD